MSTAPENEHASSLPGLLGRIDSLISRLESFVLAAGVMLMALNSVANVIGRFVFKSSIFFSEELNLILIVLITFAGVGYAARNGRHIRMSAIFDALPLPLRKKLMILIASVTALVMYALCWFAIGYIAIVAESGRVLSSLQIPVWWIYVWVPAGFLVTAVQYTLTAIKNITGDDVYLSTTVKDGYEDV